MYVGFTFTLDMTWPTLLLYNLVVLILVREMTSEGIFFLSANRTEIKIPACVGFINVFGHDLDEESCAVLGSSLSYLRSTLMLLFSVELVVLSALLLIFLWGKIPLI